MSPAVAILDDFFPQKLSAFRFEEIHTYLEEVPGVSVHATWPHLRNWGETRSPAEVFAEYAREHPEHAGRVRPLFSGSFPAADAYYTIFLSNIRDHLAAIEHRRRPFAFTLYPGGGFALEKPEADACMARVFGSPWFRRVVATQPITRDYLLAKGFCRPDQIVYVPGVVIPRSAFEPPPPKPRFGYAKAELDIAFVAAKYSPVGADKGYDLFVAAAQLLVALGIRARFHVVGGFDPGVLDLGVAGPHMRFYGYRPREFFRQFYSLMDLVLAPTRPFVLPHAFDGFPTAACVEAGLQSVAVFCTDPLRLNRTLRVGEDIVIVQPDAENIVTQILTVAQNPERLAAIGENGRIAMSRAFGSEVQMGPRLAMLRSLAQA